jgi:uncharacterized membrane protein
MLEPLLVLLHVAAGVTALVIAPVAMLTRKGGGAHRRWGRVYFRAMFVIFATALALLVYRPNVFLFIISILSFYGAFSGVRSLRRRHPERGERARWPDWGAALGALAAGLSFIVWGALPLLGLTPTEAPTAFSVLGIAFGVVLSKDARDDLVSFRRPRREPLWWWTYHLERMVGSYLAAVTAFMVQNVGPLLPEALTWTVWVTPGLVGGVGIGFWVRYYRKRFGGNLAQGARAQV